MGEGRKPGERAGLQREDVLSAVKAGLLRDGFEGLSVRAVARTLGVAPNAVYTYFESKDALVDAVLDRLLGEIELQGDEANWRDNLSGLLTATRRFLLGYPDLIPLYVSRPALGPNAARLGEQMLALLEQAGVRDDAAAEAVQLLLVFTMGFAAQEAPRLQTKASGERRRRAEASFARAGESRLAAASSSLAAPPGDEAFLRGLGWLLDGIERRAAG